MNHTDWTLLKRELSQALHPSKPIYRQVGWRNGRKVYERVCTKVGDVYLYPRRNPYLQLQLKTGDPAKLKRAHGIARWFRVRRRSTAWFDGPRGFWRGLFGI